MPDSTFECSRCGAAVVSDFRHQLWHDDVDDIAWMSHDHDDD